MAEHGSGWKNWGDHPIVVIISVVAGLIAILTFIFTLLKDKENASSTASEKTHVSESGKMPITQDEGLRKRQEFALRSQVEENKRVTASSLLLKSFSFSMAKIDVDGHIVERARGEAHYFSESLGAGVTLDMVKIPEGAFLMGTRDDDLQELTAEYKRYWDDPRTA